MFRPPQHLHRPGTQRRPNIPAPRLIPKARHSVTHPGFHLPSRRRLAPTFLASAISHNRRAVDTIPLVRRPESAGPEPRNPSHFYAKNIGLAAVLKKDSQLHARSAHSRDEGKRYRITTKGDCGTRYAARVKTYCDVVTEYKSHPEAKCADSRGNLCDRQTAGLLQRRQIKVDQIKCIGKESNSLENIDEGTVHSEQNVYTEYTDPKRSEWISKIQPALQKAKLKMLVAACENMLSRRETIELRASRSKPHRKTQELLIAILKNPNLA